MSSAPLVPELRTLTGARGLAAWLVVLFHLRVTAGTTWPAWLQDGLAKGYLAVDFFFILSGFVLWLNYQPRLREQGLAATPRFLARRIARIWPLHVLMLAGAIAFAGLLTVRGTPDPVEYPWAELPLHLLLVHNWGLTDSLTWNDPSWSISSEWAAYLMFPLLVLVVDWRRLHPVLLVAIILGLAMLLGSIFTLSGGATLNHDITRLGTVRALIGFAIGTIVASLVFRPAALKVAAVLGALAAGLGAAGVHEGFYIPLGFAAILILLVRVGDHAGNPLCSRPVHYLGRISYSTYLVHYLLLVAFKLPLASATDISAALIALYLLLTLAVSIFLFHWVEAPGQKLCNRLFDRLLDRSRTLANRLRAV